MGIRRSRQTRKGAVHWAAGCSSCSAAVKPRAGRKRGPNFLLLGRSTGGLLPRHTLPHGRTRLSSIRSRPLALTSGQSTVFLTKCMCKLPILRFDFVGRALDAPECPVGSTQTPICSRGITDQQQQQHSSPKCCSNPDGQLLSIIQRLVLGPSSRRHNGPLSQQQALTTSNGNRCRSPAGRNNNKATANKSQQSSAKPSPRQFSTMIPAPTG